MLNAATVTGLPIPATTRFETGLRREKTAEFEQVIEPSAFSRLPVIVAPRFGLTSPPARIRFLIARQSRDGSCALSSAATPVTCGVAIDVPMNVEYVSFGVVLRISLPGAPRCTV